MFQFPSFPTDGYVFTVRSLILHQGGSPIRKSAGRSLFTAHRSLSQLVTSFIGSWCQGIHLTLFFTWTYIFGSRIKFSLNCLSFVNKLGFFSLRIEKAFCALFVILNLFFHLAVKLYFFTLYWKDLSNLFFKIKSVLFLSVRFTLQYTLFGFQWTYFVKPFGSTGRPGWTRTIDLTLIRRAL